MNSHIVFEVPGLFQLFLQNTFVNEDFIALAKFIIDFLIIVGRRTIQSFILIPSERFKVGRHYVDETVVFNEIRN